MPPVVRIAMWFHMLSQPVWCHHCEVSYWFADFHRHMSSHHFHCGECRLRYVDAFDSALGYLWA